MTALPNLNGWVRHLLLTIALNFASPQAIVYGYLVPVFFLVAFGSVFRTDSPPLQAHMGQILTITILGGACFGLPTALVSEREQGVWRRYRLLPLPVAWLVLSAMIARVLIVASAVLIQIALARAVYGTPLPTQPGSAVLAFFFVTAAFLALGLLIAALADTVPAVQALGQCIFLPMIMIGGVGVPLTALPDWAQHVAGFMPGRYAVEVLQPCFDGRSGLPGTAFRLGALAVIGLAAGVTAARLFRWEAGARIGRPARLWVTAALTAWISVGPFAWQTGRLQPILPDAAPWTNITEAQIAEIHFDSLPADHDLVAPLAPPTLDSAQAREFAAKLDLWPQGKLDHSIVRDERRGGDGVGLGWVGGLDAPYAGSGALVERDESPVERAYIDFAVVDGYPAVDHIATEKIGSLAGNLGIVAPFHLSCSGVEGEHHVPGAGGIDDPIFHDGRGFESARGPKFHAPRETEPRNGPFIDLVEWAEAPVGLRAAV